MKRILIFVVVLAVLFLGCVGVQNLGNKPGKPEEKDSIFIEKMRKFSEESYKDGWFLVRNGRVKIYGYTVWSDDMVMNTKVKVPGLYVQGTPEEYREIINVTIFGFYRPNDIIQEVCLKEGIIYIGNNLPTHFVSKKYYYENIPGHGVKKYPEIVIVDINNSKFIVYIANFEEISKKYNISLKEKVQCDVSAFYFGYLEIIDPYKFYNPGFFMMYLSGSYYPIGFSGKSIKGFYYGWELKQIEITKVRKFTTNLNNETVVVTYVDGYIK